MPQPISGSAASGPVGVRSRVGFRADQAVAARRDADRAAAVVGVRDRDDAGGDRRRRAAARSAGAAPAHPGIVNRAVEDGLGGGVVAELGRLGGADQDQAGAAEARHQLGVVREDDAAREAAAEVERDPGGVADQLLDHERHAAERPVGDAGRDLLGARVGEHLEHGVESGVDAGDAVERRLPQLGGGRFLLADQLGEAERVVLRVFVESHRTSFGASLCTFNPRHRQGAQYELRADHDRDPRRRSPPDSQSPREAQRLDRDHAPRDGRRHRRRQRRSRASARWS